MASTGRFCGASVLLAEARRSRRAYNRAVVVDLSDYRLHVATEEAPGDGAFSDVGTDGVLRLLTHLKSGVSMVTESEAAEHYLRVGQIVNNLQTLELLIRTYLTLRNKLPLPALHAAQVGDVVPLSPMTDYRQLRALIRDYNAQIAGELRIDVAVADVRDALAHGRVTGLVNTPMPLRLLKFSDPASASVVEVTHSTELTVQWFDEQRELVHKQVLRLQDAFAGIGEDLRLF